MPRNAFLVFIIFMISAFWPGPLPSTPAAVPLFAASSATDSAGSPRAVPATADSAASPRVVVRLQELVVHGTALHDPLSSETVHLLPTAVLRGLPIDRLSDLIALQPGVVARGEDLHVRGGRGGESKTLLQGVGLNEPLRGRSLEVPLIALRDAELVTGGQDADLGGALAGILNLRTVEPSERAEGELQWETDGRRVTHYDRVAGRVAGPLGSALGVSASAEVMLDDTYLPALRSEGRHELLGASLGWRADSRLRAHLKLGTRSPSSRLSLEVLGSRRIDQPFDPMWSLDGWVTPCVDPNCDLGPHFSAEPQAGYSRYRAADHAVMTDTRDLLAILSWQRLARDRRLSAALGWLRSRSITSIDGGDHESYLTKERAPLFGLYDSPTSDPFHVYGGDEPYFRRSRGDQLTLRADYVVAPPRGDFLKLGAGATYDAVALRELDVSTFGLYTDSLRAYEAWAPGGFAYAHVRRVFEGLVANGGLRAECFTAGPQADRQSFPRESRAVWSLSPRLGVAYPVSVRDVLSLSYVRIQQDPGRDFLYDNRRLVTNRQPVGNPALEPATVISYQAALKHLFGVRWSVQASLFYRDLFGLIGARNLRPELDVPLLRYENADEAHATGWEWTLLRADERSRAELDYTYLEASGTWSREEGVPFGPRLRARPESIGGHPLDWDRRHSLTFTFYWQRPERGSVSWSTIVGSGLPWTPRPRRELEADVSQENSERFKWEESSRLAVRWMLPRWWRRATVGLDVRNVFDHRGDAAATADGYPNPLINTVYDDYAAYRAETGRGGGAYYNDRDGDGLPGWVPVHDPRLMDPPREVRMFLGAAW